MSFTSENVELHSGSKVIKGHNTQGGNTMFYDEEENDMFGDADPVLTISYGDDLIFLTDAQHDWLLKMYKAVMLDKNKDEAHRLVDSYK